jgi:ketosteroid isomerase-like protein
MLANLIFATALASSSAAPTEIIPSLFAAFNRHDAAALQLLYAPAASLTSSDFCRPRTGADVGRTYAALFRTFPDIQDHVDTILIQGDRAAVRFTSESHAPGKSFHMKLATFFRFRHGRIVDDDTVFDTGGRPCEP